MWAAWAEGEEPEGRLGLEPLARAAGAATLVEMAERLGVRRETVRRAARGGVSERRADEWATRLGQYPGSVWDEYGGA